MSELGASESNDLYDHKVELLEDHEDEGLGAPVQWGDEAKRKRESGGDSSESKKRRGEDVVFKAPSVVHHIGAAVHDAPPVVNVLQMSEVLEFGKLCSATEPDTPVIRPHDPPIPSAPSLHECSISTSMSEWFTHDAVITPSSYRGLDTTAHLSPRGHEMHATARKVLATLQQAYCPKTDTFKHTQPSSERGRAVLTLLQHALRVLAAHPQQHLELEGDTWVVGDVHGSYKDLRALLNKLLLFGEVTLSPHRILFLGDYVDRGRHGLECLVTVLALKMLSPTSVFLLRGNHEDPVICGDVKTYGDGSFLFQCRVQHGEHGGQALFDAACDVFAQLPLCATVAGVVFCAHGGVPRGGRLPSGHRFPSLFSLGTPAPQHEAELRTQRDLLWGDPCGDDSEADAQGFTPSKRGKGLVDFTAGAAEEFLAARGCSVFLRAHEEKSSVYRQSASPRVITVSSSSEYSAVSHHGVLALVKHDGQVELVVLEPDTATAVPGAEPLSQTNPA